MAWNPMLVRATVVFDHEDFWRGEEVRKYMKFITIHDWFPRGANLKKLCHIPPLDGAGNIIGRGVHIAPSKKALPRPREPLDGHREVSRRPSLG